ncbi:hypothetical protein SCANM63S_05591 [Streptomyces canarius]
MAYAAGLGVWSELEHLFTRTGDYLRRWQLLDMQSVAYSNYVLAACRVPSWSAPSLWWPGTRSPRLSIGGRGLLAFALTCAFTLIG